MSGTLKGDIDDDSVTHVFVEDDETSRVAVTGERLRASERTSVKVVKCRWIEECFSEMVASMK